MKFRVPKLIAMTITTLQLLQMFAGVYISLYTVWIMYIVGSQSDCPHRFGLGVLVCLVIYLIFVILFGKFFIDNYVSKGKVKPKKM